MVHRCDHAVAYASRFRLPAIHIVYESLYFLLEPPFVRRKAVVAMQIVSVELSARWRKYGDVFVVLRLHENPPPAPPLQKEG